MTVYERCSLETLIEVHKKHQRRVRGLREKTLHGYEQFVRRFVRATLGNDTIDFTQLSPFDVIQFFTSPDGRYSAASMKTVRTALRSFFSFLRVEGLCDRRLEAAIPSLSRLL